MSGIPRNEIFIGLTFARLTILADAPRDSANRRRLACLCSCGRRIIADAYNIKSGHTRSCGCMSFEHRQRLGRSTRIHGHSLIRPRGHYSCSRTYGAWTSMLQRCHNKHAHAFEAYGARGISVTKPWRDDFRNFLNDMGEVPVGRSLDRIDNRFGYFPSNCRWATAQQQRDNSVARHTRRDDSQWWTLLVGLRMKTGAAQ